MNNVLLVIPEIDFSLYRSKLCTVLEKLSNANVSLIGIDASDEALTFIKKQIRLKECYTETSSAGIWRDEYIKIVDNIDEMHIFNDHDDIGTSFHISYFEKKHKTIIKHSHSSLEKIDLQRYIGYLDPMLLGSGLYLHMLDIGDLCFELCTYLKVGSPLSELIPAIGYIHHVGCQLGSDMPQLRGLAFACEKRLPLLIRKLLFLNLDEAVLKYKFKASSDEETLAVSILTAAHLANIRHIKPQDAFETLIGK